VASRAEQLRAQADEAERLDAAAARLHTATEAYRADPSEANRRAYKDAAESVAAARTALRLAEGRIPGAGMSVGGDAVLTTPEG
jgi:hypothetical protein